MTGSGPTIRCAGSISNCFLVMTARLTIALARINMHFDQSLYPSYFRISPQTTNPKVRMSGQSSCIPKFSRSKWQVPLTEDFLPNLINKLWSERIVCLKSNAPSEFGILFLIIGPNEFRIDSGVLTVNCISWLFGLSIHVHDIWWADRDPISHHGTIKQGFFFIIIN